MSSTPSPSPPPPAGDDISVTPPTSPQRHQQATRNQECTLRQIGSPEQRRIPAVPPHPPAAAPVTVHGQTYTHLPANLAAQAAAIPPHPNPISSRRRGRAPPQPFPLPPPPPPPPISAVASGSALHPALVPPPPVSAVASGSALGPALVPAPLTFHELAARYAALPPLRPQRHYNVQNPVSVNYNLLFDTFSYYN